MKASDLYFLPVARKRLFAKKKEVACITFNEKKKHLILIKKNKSNVICTNPRYQFLKVFL